MSFKRHSSRLLQGEECLKHINEPSRPLHRVGIHKPLRRQSFRSLHSVAMLKSFKRHSSRPLHSVATLKHIKWQLRVIITRRIISLLYLSGGACCLHLQDGTWHAMPSCSNPQTAIRKAPRGGLTTYSVSLRSWTAAWRARNCWYAIECRGIAISGCLGVRSHGMQWRSQVLWCPARLVTNTAANTYYSFENITIIYWSFVPRLNNSKSDEQRNSDFIFKAFNWLPWEPATRVASPTSSFAPDGLWR